MSGELRGRRFATLALARSGRAGPRTLAIASSATLDRNLRPAAAVFATARSVACAIKTVALLLVALWRLARLAEVRIAAQVPRGAALRD